MKLGMLILVYLVLILAISIICTKLVPKRLRQAEVKNQQLHIVLLFFTIMLFIPVLGIIAVILFTVTPHLLKAPQLLQYIKNIYYPPYLKEHIPMPAVFKEGEAYSSLYQNASNAAQRVWILASINAFSARLANRINKTMLGDKDYEVRLYAFSALNNQENSINNQIANALELLAKVKSQTQEGELRKQLALLYWELVYRNLVEEELVEDILGQVMLYLKTALLITPADVELFVLLGRINLMRGKFQRAQVAFDYALKLKVPENKIVPYQAEMYFEQRNFNALRECLQAAESIGDIPAFAAIDKFWRQV